MVFPIITFLEPDGNGINYKDDGWEEKVKRSILNKIKLPIFKQST